MKRLRSRAVLVATTLALVLMSTGVLAVVRSTPAQAHSSTVTVLDGQVLVRHENGQFAPITDGDVVAGGDTVRTSAASHGVLTFFDGTTIELEPDTEVTITTLRASASGDKVVEISQAIGRTWHVVTHLASSSSKYEIKTGASTAAVRGTAFEVAVLADGTTKTITTDGDVSTSAQGSEVHVLAGQVTTVTQGSPPPPPQTSPEAAATVRITVDLTQNAIVTDANGRAVGVQNGLPVRYIPGSRVEIIDGKLVLTIPNAQLGVLSTFIRPDAAPFGGTTPDAVTVQTQVTVKDVGVVANSLTSRPVENGTAKGAVVITDTGLLLVPNSDAKNAPDPHIGRTPAAPTGILPFFTAPTLTPLMTPAPTAAPLSAPTSPIVEIPKALDLTAAAFIPYRAITTAPATATSVATTPVNTGVVTITTPLEPVFKTTITPSTTIGVRPLATPELAPVFNLTPTLTLPTTVFATPTPVLAPPTLFTPSLEVKPVVTPEPTVGGFLPPPNVFTPIVPTTAPVITKPLTPIVVITPEPTVLPTAPPLLIGPIFSAPPVFIAPTSAPTAPPLLIGPVLTLPTNPPPVIVTKPPLLIAPLPTLAPAPQPIFQRCIIGITC